MPSVTYYFSGTGNNLATAKELSTYILDMEIRPITQLLHDKIIPEQFDLVGFILPAYYGHIPPLAADCLSGVQFSKHQRVFSIIACAGMRGYSIEDIRKLLSASGKAVQYEFMLVYPDNGILVHGPYAPWQQKLLLSFTKSRIKKIASQLKKPDGSKVLKKSLLYSQKIETSFQQSISEFSSRGLAFIVSEDCIHCGSCVKVCPAGNVRMQNNTVTFGPNCQQCMACIQWCPAKAIDYKGLAKERQRYRHPDITIGEMIEYNGVTQNDTAPDQSKE